MLFVTDSSSVTECSVWVDVVESPVPTLRTKRATWSEDSLIAAVRDVRNGVSTHKAALQHGIPRWTLRNHINKEQIVRHLGRHGIFSEDQETDFIATIVKLADLGLIPLTPKMIQIQAYAFCRKFNIPNNFNKERKMGGKAWLKLFLSRNPDLQCKVQIINGVQAKKINKSVKEVLKLYDELNLREMII